MWSADQYLENLYNESIEYAIHINMTADNWQVEFEK